MDTNIITNQDDEFNAYMPNTSNYMVQLKDGEIVTINDIINGTEEISVETPNTETSNMVEVVSKNFQGKQLIID